jgi:hypothetical protein
MKYLLIVYLCLWFLAACQNNPSEGGQRKALESRVMQVHDAAMAEMDQIFILRQDLKKLRDTLQSRQADTAAQRLVEQHLGLLQKADEAMMHWMHQYKSPEEKQSHEAAMQYLQHQLQKMEQVKKQMDSTLAAAQSIYKQHEPNK